MEFTDTRTTERHTASASATITAAAPMHDVTTRWMGNRYETVGIPFRPDRAEFRWTWDDRLGWVLTQITASGYALKKDGSDGVKRRSIDFIRKGEIVESTPAALVALADKLAPKSRVVEP